MARVLVVDDEQGYRDYLERALRVEGHDVRVAESGRRGVEVGTRFRPDVLVVDWMLKDEMHGLHVTRALRVARAEIQAILITGFPSPELQAEAEDADIFAFMQKPFDLDRMVEVVGRAARGPASKATEIPIGLIEIDSEGNIVHANAVARKLFASTLAGSDAMRLDQMFDPQSLPDFETAAENWHIVSPRCRSQAYWHIRTQPYKEGMTRLVVILRPDDPHFRNRQLVEMLLGVDEERETPWPFEGRVVVVDQSAVYRRFIVSTLESAGAICYPVSGCGEALRLLDTDAGIGFMIIDSHTAAADLDSCLAQLRRRRPELILIGNTEDPNETLLGANGIERVLLKPWRIRDLIQAIQG
jgi:DNA-binding NtrC family response regulator